jgi:hypothetical protein
MSIWCLELRQHTITTNLILSKNNKNMLVKNIIFSAFFEKQTRKLHRRNNCEIFQKQIALLTMGNNHLKQKIKIVEQNLKTQSEKELKHEREKFEQKLAVLTKLTIKNEREKFQKQIAILTIENTNLEILNTKIPFFLKKEKESRLVRSLFREKEICQNQIALRTIRNINLQEKVEKLEQNL